jgi:uncharacterized phage infection (PIP) family protein YhgE
MARVTTHTAAKDYPAQGIKKGETYYQWTPYRRGVQRSKTKPTPSQVSSAKTAVILDAIEGSRKIIDEADEPDEIQSAVEEVGNVANDVLAEYDEALEAWPNGNSQIEEKRDTVQSFIDECESFSADTTAYNEAVEAVQEAEKKIAAQEESKEKDAVTEADRSALDTELEDARTAVEDALQDLRDEATAVLDSAEF